MQPGSTIPHSQEPANFSYPESPQSKQSLNRGARAAAGHVSPIKGNHADFYRWDPRREWVYFKVNYI